MNHPEIVFFDKDSLLRHVCIHARFCIFVSFCAKEVLGATYIWTWELVHVCAAQTRVRRTISFHAILFLI